VSGKITIIMVRDGLWKLYFSGLKSVMGEIIKARRPEYIAQEIAMKVHYYNIMRQITEIC